MGIKQQDQTQKYFNLHANNWNEQAKWPSYNTIIDRNNAVIDCFQNHGQVRDFLDVGCGSGQLVIEVAEHDVNSVGIDFALEMIKICKAKSDTAKSKAIFEHCSVFDYPSTSN